MIDWSSDVCSSDLYPSAITSGTEVDYRTTTIAGPDRKTVFYVDRRFQSLNESRVIARDVLDATGTQLLQRTESMFALGDYVGMHWYMCPCDGVHVPVNVRSEEHTSELQSLMRLSYAVFCLKTKKTNKSHHIHTSVKY